MCSLNFSRKSSPCAKASGVNCHSHQPCMRVLVALHSRQHLVLSVLHCSHFGGGLVELHGGFILYLPDNYISKTTFHMFKGHLGVFFLHEIPLQITCLFLNWIVCHFLVDLLGFFIYSGYQSCVTSMNCKDIFPLCEAISETLSVTCPRHTDSEDFTHSF